MENFEYRVINAWLDGRDLPCLEVIVNTIHHVIFCFNGIEVDIKSDGKLQLWYQLEVKKSDKGSVPDDFENIAESVLCRIWAETVSVSD